MSDPKPRLYELVMENGRSASPYVWRVRYVLAHKGLEYQSVPVGFADIPTVLGGRFATVPILEDGVRVLGDSWEIVEYLDRAYSRGAALFAGASEIATTRLFDAWLHSEVMRRMFRIYALDIHNAARPEDRAYFRASRETRLKGRTLEEFTADRAQHLPELRAALAPLRAQLARFPFLGGFAPNYADHMVLALLQWVASVSTLPMLAADDRTLRDWIARGFELYGGVGRDPRQQPLCE